MFRRMTTFTLMSLSLIGTAAHAAQHDHDTLFSRDNAVMAAAAVERVNAYCVELGSMSPEYSLQNAMMIRETIEGLSQEVLHETYTFSEEDEMYLQGVSLGEKLDKVVLENCLGGRYSPGIDLTFIVRDVNLYQQKWQGEAGPFRINQQRLDYQDATPDQPFLNIGYIPLNKDPVEPGDLSKFMAQPWHTDYNSCAVHEPDPNPPGNNTLYWSWPAQRPVQVYPVDLCTFDESSQTWSLGRQLFSVRGEGTETDYPQNRGRFQRYIDYVENWHKTGFVIQGIQVKAEQGNNYGVDKFIEVASQYKSEGDLVQPGLTSAIPED